MRTLPLLLAFVFGIGCTLIVGRGCYRLGEGEGVRTDTVHVRTAPPRRVIIPPRPSRPIIVTEYLESPPVIEQCLSVPEAYAGDFVLAAPEPITVTASRVTFPHFVPSEGIFRVSTYRIPERRRALWLDVGLERPLAGPQIDARANGRIGRLSAFVGYSASQEAHGAVFGARMHLIGRR